MLDQVVFGKRVHERRKAQLLTQEQLGDALCGGDAGLSIAYRLQAGRVMSVDLLDPKGLAVLVLDQSLQSPPDEAKLDAMRTLLAPVCWKVAQALLNGPHSEAAVGAALGECSTDEVREAIASLMKTDLVMQDHAGYRLDCSGGAPAIVALLRVLSGLRPAVTGTTYQ